MRIRRCLVAVVLALVGSVAFSQSGWVQMTNSALGQASGSTGGLLGLPTNLAYDGNIAQISWAHQGGRGPFISFISPQSQWVMIVPMDDGSLWRSADGGQTLTKVFSSPYAVSGSRPQHAVRLPNGAIYVAYAPTSNDVGTMVNSSNVDTIPVPSSGSSVDHRYEVFRSADGGLTWEDTTLATISGLSAAGNDVEITWGGWYDPGGGLYSMDAAIYTWSDPGMGAAWGSIAVANPQNVVGSSYANTMMWTESYRSGGSASNNYLASTLTGGSMYTMGAWPAGTCGGMDNTRDDTMVIDPTGAVTRDLDWQGIDQCNGGDNVQEPLRGGSVTGWDGSYGITLCTQGKDGNGYPALMGMFNATGASVGPGGNAISGYQHSVASVGGSLALTFNSQVYTSGDQGANWTQISSTLPGSVDSAGSFSFPAGGTSFADSRILLANLNSSNYSDRRLIALTQDALGASAKGSTRVWVYTDTPSLPVIQMADGGTIQASGFAACTGDTVTLTITSPSTDLENDPIEYQWQSSPDGNIWNNIGPLSTSLTYQVLVGANSAGEYRVIASSALNGTPLAQTASNPVSLAVAPAPGFSSIPASSTACSTQDQVLVYTVSGPPNAIYSISISCNGSTVPTASLANSSGSTPSTIALGGSGFGSFTVFIPGAMLTNNRGDGYTQSYAFNATISAN